MIQPYVQIKIRGHSMDQNEMTSSVVPKVFFKNSHNMSDFFQSIHSYFFSILEWIQSHLGNPNRIPATLSRIVFY